MAKVLKCLLLSLKREKKIYGRKLKLTAKEMCVQQIAAAAVSQRQNQRN